MLAGCGDDATDGSDTDTDAGTTPQVVEVEGTIVDSFACEACGGGCTRDSLDYPSRSHLDATINYVDPPPAGGDHNRCWARWGVYDEPLSPIHWVHNMEHGGIVVLYDCTDCDAEIAELTSWVASLGDTAILTPFEGLPTPFAVVSWGERMLMDCVDVDAMRDFYDQNFDNAPESTLSGPPSGCMD